MAARMSLRVCSRVTSVATRVRASQLKSLPNAQSVERLASPHEAPRQPFCGLLSAQSLQVQCSVKPQRVAVRPFDCIRQFPLARAYAFRHNDKMHIAVCRACKQSYMQSRSDQRYCSAACRERGRSLGVSGGILTRDVILFREQIRRLAKRGEVGYRLLLVELDVWFPIPGRSRRWGGGWRDAYYYSLNPFEPPRVPLEARYQLVFVDQHFGHRIPDAPYGDILVTFPEDMSRVPALAQALAQRKRMEQHRRHQVAEEMRRGAAVRPPSESPADDKADQPPEDDEDAGF